MDRVKRLITEKEKTFISDLLKLANANFKIPESVIQLEDGGMGSLQFTNNVISDFIEIIDVTYIDTDNITVLISLRAKGDNLTEIDFWKTDFSALKEFPTIDKVQITNK